MQQQLERARALAAAARPQAPPGRHRQRHVAFQSRPGGVSAPLGLADAQHVVQTVAEGLTRGAQQNIVPLGELKGRVSHGRALGAPRPVSTPSAELTGTGGIPARMRNWSSGVDWPA